MSIPEVYITSAIHQAGVTGYNPAVIRTELTQFFDLKVSVPRKGYRTASLRVNLLNTELNPLYTGNGFKCYSNFLYIIWRGHVVFWGPILIKEIDYEESSLTLQASDQGARLEHHYFRIGDEAMGVGGDATVGLLPVGYEGVRLSIQAGKVPTTATTYIPLGIKMGSDNHNSLGSEMKIERGQEVWRTLLDMGERTDGPLIDLRPLDIDDGEAFATVNVYNQFRDDISDTVQFHYGTGLRNVRNMRPTEGGEVLSHVHVVTQDNHWRTTTSSNTSGANYGVWIQWEQVDFNLKDSISESEAEAALGAVGDAIMDVHGRPLTTVEIVMKRDDQIGVTNLFHWITDFHVSDIIEVKGVKGGEALDGKYQIDEVRLEQEGDNSGQVRQAIDVIPWVVSGQYSYQHATDFVEDEVQTTTRDATPRDTDL